MTAAQNKSKDSIMPYNAAEKSLGVGNIKPLYLLAGRKLWVDAYLRDKFIKKVREVFLGDDSGVQSLEIFHVGADKPEVIINALATSSLFSEKKLILIHDIQRLSDEGIKKIGQYAASPIPENCLILISMNFDARRKWYNSLKSKVFAVKIETPFDNQIPSWISSFARQRGKNISADASRLFGEYTGSSLMLLDMEMEKLSLFIGDKKDIDEDDVKDVIGFSKQLSPFDLEKYLSKKDLHWSLKALNDMLDRGENAPSISIQIFNFLMTVLIAKDDGAEPSARWSPREELKKEAVRNWSREELLKGIELVKEADFKTKQTNFSNGVIFSELAVRLLSGEGVSVV
ncbi:MAG: DNA polymerase III subunit delta [Candidatus Marinimicrobia bacterium]|nr:DNA polymerase III subunit delta [Candidatus Neomarinimicrobiota bacterium]